MDAIPAGAGVFSCDFSERLRKVGSAGRNALPFPFLVWFPNFLLIGGDIMRRSKVFLFLLCLMLCVSLLSAALAESALSDLWNSGCNLLFHTDNVTADGEAEFLLDGQYFKTAKLHYVQDGYCSYYGLGLLTPRKNGDIQETGWTIIENELGVYNVMEVYTPGVYANGAGVTPHNTLLRRSVELDALTALGSAVLSQVEPLLPQDMITAEEKEGGRSLRLHVTEEQIPDLAQSALNLAAGYLSNRWFGLWFDRSVATEDTARFEDYITVTQALLDGTVNWKLRDADVEFTLDAQGRITGVEGYVKAASTYRDGTVREVEVKGNLSFTAYGESKVKPFDPKDYGVVTYQEMYGNEEDIPDLELDEAAWEEWHTRAVETLKRQGYEVSPQNDWGGWTSVHDICIQFTKDDGPMYFCSFAEDGNLMCLRNEAQGWLGAEEKEPLDDEPDAAAAEAFVRAFVAQESPDWVANLEYLTLQSVLTAQDGTRYLTFTNGSAFFIVLAEPSMQMEFYTAY